MSHNNAHNALPLLPTFKAHLFNKSFHIKNEQCGSEAPPEKILSVLLAFHTNTENLTKWLCYEVYDCIVQLLRLLYCNTSLQKASKLTLCVDILFPRKS